MQLPQTNSAPRVLIVDDEESIRKILSRKLTLAGFSCVEADNADNAMQRLSEGNIDIVLSDIAMPGKSGIQLLNDIKQAHPDRLVIMVSANENVDVAIGCIRRGAYDYITKPFNLDSVQVIVERALEKLKLERELKEYQTNLEQKVQVQASQIRDSFLHSVTSLANALEAKDTYTHGHSERVTLISLNIAQVLGLPAFELSLLRQAALVHDIGKIGIREAVLNKPDRLTDDEFKHIKQHPEIGEHILAPIVEDIRLLDVVRHHHERYDGLGYPDKLAGEKISILAKTLAVADAFDAMTSQRPYRAAMEKQVALGEIMRNRKAQFDPIVVDALLRTQAVFPDSL